MTHNFMTCYYTFMSANWHWLVALWCEGVRLALAGIMDRSDA